jgi:hypothetical protein
MTTNIHNIIETTVRNSNKSKMNMLYNDMVGSVCPLLLMESKYLNFIRTSNISEEILDIGYSSYFTNDYLETNKKHKLITNMMHVHGAVTFLDPPLRLLKKEDLIILGKSLRDSKNLCFNQNIYNIWKEHININKLDPGIPEFEFNDTKDRKSIIIISEINRKQAKSLSSQIRGIAKDAGLLVDLSGLSVRNVLNILGQYKIALVLDNSLSALLSLASGCSVISPFPFYDEIITYSNSDELNIALAEALNLFDNGQSKDISSKIIEQHNFENFDKELYRLIIDLTKEPFIL